MVGKTVCLDHCHTHGAIRTLTIIIGDTEATFDIIDADNETGVIVRMDGKEITIPLKVFLNSLFDEKE